MNHKMPPPQFLCFIKIFPSAVAGLQALQTNTDAKVEE